jgi:Ni/Fe-hydrogenase 1 B-type cytochrome subunit
MSNGVNQSAAAPVADYHRVYVWELPVRIFHWVNAACIAILCGTGYVIGSPLHLFSSPEAYTQYWFGIVRFTHFLTAFVFSFNLLMRLYWGFVGNGYCRWKTYLPLTKRQRQEVAEVMRADVFQVKLHGPLSLGHNALASTIYVILFLVSLVQVVTGFVLYSSMSRSFLPRLFGFVRSAAGSEFGLRFVHHVAMWFFILFVLVHVYLTFYHDYIEGRGTISSIVGGWKFHRRPADTGKHE